MATSVFFAYESGHPENKDSVDAAITLFNKHQSSMRALSWENLNVSGSILNASVLKAIDDCDVFACDMTYLNHNVLFELGYAIGRAKELLVLLNRSVQGARDSYESSRLLRNIGYTPFANGNDILRALQQHRFEHETSVSRMIEARIEECDTLDLLYLESPAQTQASLDVKAYLANAEGRVIINDTSEIEYQTLSWYVTSLVKARSVLIHLLGHETQGQDLYNGEYSFYAGVAAGLGKAVVLIAPKPFRAPIDYSDILLEYDSSHDCQAKVAGWHARQLSEREQKPAVSGGHEEDRKTNLLHLGVGYEMAEEEADLLSYFVEIETYKNATRRNTSIITGRKGAGKTAIFLKLRADFESRKGNAVTIVLKPESDELLGDVELTRLYDSVSSRQAFLTSVWRYVILSRLLVQVAYRIEALPSFAVDPTPEETEVVQYVAQRSLQLGDGHFSFIARLYRHLDEQRGFGNQRALEALYNDHIGPIQRMLRNYFRNHSYTEINVLADNLDKTWDAQHGLDLQADMILSLLSFNERIPTELANDTLKPHTVVFLRNDIFEYVLDRAREPDKLIARGLEVNWHRFPEKLRELIEARFRYSMNRGPDEPVDDVWKDYFALNRRGHPFDILRQILVSRPRDHIFFLSKMFESAVNRNDSSVGPLDLDYALDAYSNYLYRNMIAETRARFPEIVDVLKDVQKRTQTGSMDYRDLLRLLASHGLSEPRSLELIEFLYDKDYVYAYLTSSGKVLTSYSQVEELRSERRFLLFRRHRITIQIHPSRDRLASRSVPQTQESVA